MKHFILACVVTAAAACSSGNDVQCIRAIECVEQCGGPIVQSGCNPCPEGSFDNIECRAADAGPRDAP